MRRTQRRHSPNHCQRARNRDIRESTANGIGNPFHAEWKAAERGDSEYEAIFLPWFWHEDTMTEAPAEWSPPAVWQEYRQTYGLTRAAGALGMAEEPQLAVIAGGSPMNRVGSSSRNTRPTQTRRSKPLALTRIHHA